MIIRLPSLFTLAIVLISLLPMALPTMLHADDALLLQEDFSNPSKGFAEKLLKHPKITLAEGDGVDNSNCIRVAYVGGDMGSERVVVHFPLQDKVTFAQLSFDVYFEDDWQWVRAGKMHGVGPAKIVSGGRPKQPDGWSSRMMWHRDGGAHNYLYDQDQSRKYGKGDRTEGPVMEKQRWHHIVFETKLNDPGKANGEARMYVDGELVAEDNGVEFRGVGGEETLIQKMLFSTFHGGNDPSWAPRDENGDYTTVHARFDNFVVTAPDSSVPAKQNDRE